MIDGPGGTTRLQRVVMVSTSFWQLRRFDRQQLAGLRGLLEALLTRGPGAAAIHEPPAVRVDGRLPRDAQDAETVVDRFYGGGPANPRWWSGSSARAASSVDAIMDSLQRIGEERKADRISAQDAVRLLRSLTIRVYLDPERAAALFGSRAGTPYHVCLDVALTRTSLGDKDNYLCAVSASVWSSRPYSAHHAPPSSVPRGPVTGGLRAVSDFYLSEVRAGVRRLLHGHLGWVPAIPTIQNTPYIAPVYWIVVGDDPEYTEQAVRHLLGTTDLTAAPVTSSRLVGGQRLHRRVRSEDGVVVPFSVLVPDKPEDVRDGDGDAAARAAVHEARVRQEEHAALAVVAMTELEVQVVTAAFDIDTDLGLWENHARLYAASAEHVAGLWDALAMHLPVAEGEVLDKVHSAVALIHQTLLQSVADLDYVARRISAAGAELERRTYELQAEFDARVAERREPHVAGSAPLGDDGDIGFERRRITRAAAEVDLVRSEFRSLFDSITKAFDERRTRETDQFTKMSSKLGVAVGVLAVINLFGLAVPVVLPLTLPASEVVTGAGDATPGPAYWVLLTIVALGIVAGLLVLRVVRGSTSVPWMPAMHGRPIGDDDFRKHYPALRDFLRMVSTAELRTLSRRLEPRKDQEVGSYLEKASEIVGAYLGSRKAVRLELPEGTSPADRREALRTAECVAWNLVDRALSGLLTKNWRIAHSTPDAARSRDVDHDVAALLGNVGHWTLQSMLLSERPPELHKFNLPWLVALYCALSASEESLLARTSSRTPVTAISADDMWWVLRGLGFSPSERRHIYSWLCRRRAEPAGRIAADVGRLGLRNGMDEEQREVALGVVHERSGSPA